MACSLRPVLIAFFLSCAGSAWAISNPADDLAAFEGDWSLVDSEHGDLARRSAIDEAAGGLSWVVRKFAVGALKKTTAPPPKIQFSWDGERLRQRVAGNGGERSRAIEIGGQPRDGKDSRGESFSSSWRWTDSGLQLNWVQHQAHGHNLYRVDSVSGTLVVQYMIQVDAISNMGPIVYESRFGRSDLPRISAGQDTGAASQLSETRQVR
jgi:hypothetical protein